MSAAWKLVLACLLATSVGCSRDQPQPEVPDVAPPPELAQLDLAVREQFEQLWRPQDTESGRHGERHWGALGQWFHVYRYSDSAEQCYERAIKQFPDDPRWPYLLGVLMIEKGRPEVAQQRLLQALSLAPDAAQVQVQLADLARTQGQLAAAEDAYASVLAEHPQDAAARFGMGQLALQRGDAQTALRWLEPLGNEQPDAAELNYALGTAWRMIGDGARSASVLAKVPESNVHQLPLERDDPWLLELQRMDRGARQLSRRGIRAANEGDHQRAAVLFGAAVQSDPDGAEERLNWALALSRIGNYQAALDQIELALQRTDADSSLSLRVRLERARILAQSGSVAVAEAQLEALLLESPTDTQIRLELARLLHTRGELRTALAHYETLRLQGSSGQELAFWQAAARLAIGDREAAAEQLRSDRDLFPNSLRLQLLQWRLEATEDQPDRAAMASALSALGRLPRPLNVLQIETKAMLFAANGDTAAATDAQRAVVSALATEAYAPSRHIAQRRLTLYAEGARPLKAWEAAERPIVTPVGD